MAQTANAVQELNDANFKATLEGVPLAIVDIYASWCGACRLFAPSYEMAAAKHVGIPFFKIDGDANQEFRAELTIPNLPYFAVFRHGKFSEGVATTSEEALEDFIRKSNGKK